MCDLILTTANWLCTEFPCKQTGAERHHLFTSPQWDELLQTAGDRLRAVESRKDHHSNAAVALVVIDVVQPVVVQAYSLSQRLPQYKQSQLQGAVDQINHELLHSVDLPRRLPG